MNTSLAHWNQIVHLVKPRANDIRSATGLQLRPYHTKPIQAAAALTDNLFVSYYLREYAAPNPEVLSIWIAFKDIFHDDVSVKPETLLSVSLFGVRVPCSAQTFLQQLKISLPNVPLQLTTELDKFAIQVGSAKIEFYARSGVATTPEESDLATVTFFFSMSTTNPDRYEFSAVA